MVKIRARNLRINFWKPPKSAMAPKGRSGAWMSPRGVLPAPARDSGVLRGGAGNHFSKGVPEFLEGTGVADLGKSRQNEDNVTFTPPGRERTPPIAPQLRQTQCLGGGKGEAPPLRLREERGLRESAWGWGWGALRHRVPARSGLAGRGGGR